MPLAFDISRRYLFAKKSTNAIHLITGIAVFGVAIGTAAMLIILSVFNGFNVLFLTLFSNFNPDIKVRPTLGKVFEVDAEMLAKMRKLDGIDKVSVTVEEIAFFQYNDQQTFGILKGVDSIYHQVTAIDSVVRDGKFDVSATDVLKFGVFGLGMANKLLVDPGEGVQVFMAKSENVSAMEAPFRRQILYPSGIFNFQQDYDQQYVLADIDFVRGLLNKPDVASAYEIRLQPQAQPTAVQAQLATLLGEGFVAEDRYQQEAAFFKIMNMEKWLSFVILSLTILLVAFNIIGSLWMIVLDKRKDIAVLKTMGASASMIRNVFLYEGLLLCGLGWFLGASFAIGFYFLQTYFGLIEVSPGAIVSAYPIDLKWLDFALVALIVAVIGVLAALPAAAKAAAVRADAAG